MITNTHPASATSRHESGSSTAAVPGANSSFCAWGSKPDIPEFEGAKAFAETVDAEAATINSSARSPHSRGGPYACQSGDWYRHTAIARRARGAPVSGEPAQSLWGWSRPKTCRSSWRHWQVARGRLARSHCAPHIYRLGADVGGVRKISIAPCRGAFCTWTNASRLARLRCLLRPVPPLHSDHVSYATAKCRA